MNIAVIGQGSIGQSFVKQILTKHPNALVYVFARTLPTHQFENVIYNIIDYDCEESIKHCANIASETNVLNMVFVATGVLHNDTVKPEKSLNDINIKNFEWVLKANTITPALIAKYFSPKLYKSKPEQNPSVFACLSARVGSISDNKLGGWYAYRSSKSALNMILKTLSIELARRNPNTVVLGLHPGTVDSDLSKPFQKNVPQGKLFSSDFSAKCLLDVITSKTAADTGKIFAWNNIEIHP